VLAVIVIALGEPPPGAKFLLFAALAGIAETVGVAALYRGLSVGVMIIRRADRRHRPGGAARGRDRTRRAARDDSGGGDRPRRRRHADRTRASPGSEWPRAVFVVAVALTRPAPLPQGREVPVIALISLLIIAADAMYATASTKGILVSSRHSARSIRSSRSRWPASTCASGSSHASGSGSRSRSAASWRSRRASDR
jgi:hypothetical protein